MPFKTPINSTLTEVQQKALSKLNSLNTYVASPKKQFQKLKKSQQISTFDLSTRFLDGIAGPGVGDAVLSQFTRKIFATYGEDQFLLEDIIINGLAKALDKREIYLAPQLPSGETLSNSGSTSATTSVVEYDFTGIQRERSEVNVKKAINYTYTIELETDQSKIKIKNGIPYGKRFIFGNNAGFPTLLYYRPTTKSDEEIIAKSKEETETVGFTRSATGLFYPPEGTVVDSTEIKEGGMFVKLTTNVPEKLPETFIGTYSGSTGMTLDEIVRDVKIDVSKYGYYDESTAVEYPPAGTNLDEIPEIRGEIKGYVLGGEDVYLSNAVVEVVGASPPLSLLTNEEGYYSITGLQAGSYILKSSLENYTSLALDATIVNEQGAITSLDFPLTLTGSTQPTAEAVPNSGTTATGITISDGSNYNTGATSTEQSGPTGETVNLKYDYELIEQPLTYSFEKQNLPPNAPNNNYNSILLTVTNNMGLPPATVTLGPTSEDKYPRNYIELVDEMEYTKQLFIRGGDSLNGINENIVDGVTYPRADSNIYKWSVTNNANLPVYEYEYNLINAEWILEIPEANERLKEVTKIFKTSITEERKVWLSGPGNSLDLVTYPPDGAQYVMPPTADGTPVDVDEAIFLPSTGITGSSGTTGNTTFVTDSVNRFVGNVEANIVIDQDVLAAGLSGITDDLKNTIAETFSFKINPEDVGLSNKEYLDKYLKPVLNAGKRALVAQIIKMVFGPKEVMSNDPEVQEKLLNAAACGEQMFSVSNNPSLTSKQLEFNRVQLKKQLEAGKIELTVSCQKVEIQLPENFEEQFDLLPSSEVGIPETQRPNPAESLILLNNYVQSEVQRQRNEEDSTQVRQSFFQIMIEKIMQYISVAFSATPAIQTVFGIINKELAKSGQPALSPQELLSSPCEITAACKSGNKKDFEEKSSFSKSIIDSLYSLVLSMLIRKLISEAKAKIAKLIQEKAKEKILKLIRKRKEKTEFLTKLDGFADKVKGGIGKAQEFKEKVKETGLKDIFDFIKKDKSEGGSDGEVDNLDE